jgi:hypothetical protein
MLVYKVQTNPKQLLMNCVALFQFQALPACNLVLIKRSEVPHCRGRASLLN